MRSDNANECSDLIVEFVSWYFFVSRWLYSRSLLVISIGSVVSLLCG